MNAPLTRIEFGRFELDLARGELRQDGSPVELSAKPLSLLVYIAVHRDRVISKQELFDELWPDVVVGEAALSSALKDLRRALDDDGSQMRYIRTYRRRGYRFVAPSSAGSPAASRSSVPSRAPPPQMVLRDQDDQPSWYRPPSADPLQIEIPFMEREEELRALREALTAVESGQPRFQLLEGDAGSGKTRLIEEFVAQDCQFVDVAIGRARDETSRPYLAFAEALSAWISEREIRLEDVLGQESQTITRLLHPSQIGDREEWRSRLVGERERSELFASFATTVIALARRQPSVLILEDLQWADVSTLGLLEHLALAMFEAAKQAPVPLFILATTRVDPNAESHAPLERMLGEEHSDRLKLGGLSEPAVAGIMDSLGFENPPASWVSSVTELSDGNPLFVLELTRHRRDRGDRGLALPETLEVALSHRLADLSDDCLEVLTVAAMIGDSFGLLALSAACERPEDETRKLIEEAIHAGIVSGTRRAFKFEQRSWTHLLKHHLEDARRRELHGTIADVLEDLYASAEGEHAIEIANHILAASEFPQPPGESRANGSERLIRYATQAGEQSLAMYAWREAGRYFAAAAGVATGIGEADRAALHLRAGIAFNHDWDVRSCMYHYEQASAGFRRCGDQSGIAWALMNMTRARLTMASSAYGDEIEVGELGRIADGLRSSNPALRAMLLELLSEVAWMSGAGARARRLAEEALVVGHNLENDEVCHHACMGLALAAFQSLQVHEALDGWRQALLHARALRADWLAAPAATREAMALVHLGRFDEADRVLDEALAMARRAHNLGELSFGSAQRAGLRVARGDFDGASRASAESIGMMHRSRYPWGGPFAILAQATVCVYRGDFQRARDVLQDLVSPGIVFEDAGPAMVLLVAVGEVWIGSIAGRAIDEDLLENLASLVAASGQDAYLLGPACVLVDVAQRRRCVDRVLSLEPLLRLASDRSIRFSSGWVLSVDRMMAAVVLEKGTVESVDEAVSLLESSIEITTETGALPELVQAQMMLARVLRSKGRSGFDLEKDCRAKALATAEAIESPPLIDYCRLSPSEMEANLKGTFVKDAPTNEGV